MSKYSLNNFDRDLLNVIAKNPKLHGYDLCKKMIDIWIGNSKWRRRFWILFAPGSGKLYVSLAKLERFKLIKSEWGALNKLGYHVRLYELNKE